MYIGNNILHLLVYYLKDATITFRRLFYCIRNQQKKKKYGSRDKADDISN